MAYGFKSFGQKADNTPLSIRTIIDGTTLENRFNTDAFRFTTLTVSGRGSAEYRVESTDVYGRPGSLLRERSISNRHFVIRAKVKADTNENYRKGMSELNALFYMNDVQRLEFTDDLGYGYYGTCQRVQDEGEESNTQIIEIEFLVTDPFKYTNVKTHSTVNAKNIEVDSDFPVVAEEIAITFDTAAKARDFTLNNTSTGLRIRYQQSNTASGTTIKIRQKEDYIGYVDTTNHFKDVNIRFSHLDEFTVANGDQLIVTPAPVSIKIKYRGVRL